MSDITSILRNEVFRPSVTLIGPGALASSPYIILAYTHFESFKTAIHTESFLFFSFGLILFATLGLIIDSIGADIEIHNDKKIESEKDHYGLEDRWNEYLRIVFEKEPVGHRFLRTVVLKLKVELNFVPALLVTIPGIVLAAICNFVSILTVSILIVVIIIMSFWLFTRSKETSRALDDIRKEILKGAIRYPD